VGIGLGSEGKMAIAGAWPAWAPARRRGWRARLARWGRVLRLEAGAREATGALRDATGALRDATGALRDAAAGSEAAASADLRAFEAFFGQHHGDVFSYLWRLTGEEQTAYDLTQETFLRAWQHFDRVRRYERPGAWLLRVVSNLVFSHLRRRATQGGGYAPLTEEDGPATSDPAWRLAQREGVRATLMALPARQRAALVLREVYGLSGEEIAAALGISTGAVKMLLSRARESFRAHYLREEVRP
jgi:RNA polymerase sigma-70 factor, ECF subfamily